MANSNGVPFSGIVTARNCPTCGHHEIGLVSEDGVFHPLKQGARAVMMMDAMEPEKTQPEGNEIPSIEKTGKEDFSPLEGRYWIPEPLKGDRIMRLKYGVVIQKEMGSVQMNEHIYEAAFMRKLNYFLEKELYTPIAVILDRFFVAPHLASGETRDIAARMWEDLDEIRQPVERVKQWLKEPDEKSLQSLVQPDSIENLENSPVNETRALEELELLDLEDFLALL